MRTAQPWRGAAAWARAPPGAMLDMVGDGEGDGWPVVPSRVVVARARPSPRGIGAHLWRALAASTPLAPLLIRLPAPPRSRYVVDGANDAQISTVASGALDRLQSETDPCVRYDSERKFWVYLHAQRDPASFGAGEVPKLGVGPPPAL